MANAPRTDLLAQKLEQLSWQAQHGQIDKIFVLGSCKDGSYFSHMRLPDERSSATALISSMALAICLTGKKAGLSRQQVGETLQSVIEATDWEDA